MPDRLEQRHGLGRVPDRRDAGGLRERRHVVRQADALQIAHDVGAREGVADPGAGHREGLRERPHDRDVRVIGRQLENAVATELDVRLVGDDQGVRFVGETSDRVDRLRIAGRVVRGTYEDHVRVGRECLVDGSIVQDERGGELEGAQLGVRQPREPSVQRVRGLEDRGGASGSAVGEEQLGEHLVRPVRGPGAGERVSVVQGDLLAEAGHLPVRVPVEGKVADRRGQVVREGLG
jgi:hypothetical protein